MKTNSKKASGLKILKILIILGIVVQTMSCAGGPKTATEQALGKEGSAEAAVPKINMAAELAKIDTMLHTDTPSAVSAHEHYLRALDMIEEGKIVFAELFLKRALANEPKSHFLLGEVIRILLRQNKTAEAFPLLELAVKSPRATGDDFLFMARLYKEKEMLDSAAVNYKKAADVIKGNLSVLYEYAQLLEFSQKYAEPESKQNYVELKRIYDILLPELDYPPRLLEKQVLLYQITETPDSAIADLLGEAFKVNGIGYAEYAYLQAQILASLKKYSEANEVLLTLFFSHPSKEFTSRLAINIANNYELMDSITVAVIWLEQILASEPKNHIALNNLGYILINRDMDINRGITLVDKALSLSPTEPSYLDSKAWGLYKTGKYKEALEIFEKLAADGMDADELWEHLIAVCEALKLEDKVKEYKAKLKK